MTFFSSSSSSFLLFFFLDEGGERNTLRLLLRDEEGGGGVFSQTDGERFDVKSKQNKKKEKSLYLHSIHRMQPSLSSSLFISCVFLEREKKNKHYFYTNINIYCT